MRILRFGPPLKECISVYQPFYLSPLEYFRNYYSKTVCYESGIILDRLYNVESIYKPSTLGVLTHELLHAVIHIMENKSIKLSNDSEEVFTYTLDFMVTEFFTSYQKANK
jgi:hypothetical protein